MKSFIVKSDPPQAVVLTIFKGLDLNFIAAATDKGI